MKRLATPGKRNARLARVSDRAGVAVLLGNGDGTFGSPIRS
jgi:hypothetical protein